MSIGFRIASGMALSLALVSAPLAARPYYHGGYHHYHRGGGGIGLGGALLGAAILGGVAIAASNNNNRQPAYQQGYDPNTGGEYRSYGGVQNYSGQGGYAGQGGLGPDDQQAQNGDPVDACSRAAEREAQNGGGFARVAGIDRVDNIQGGVRVRGQLDINGGDRGGNQRIPFTCSAAYGDITDLRLG